MKAVDYDKIPSVHPAFSIPKGFMFISLLAGTIDKELGPLKII